MDIVEIDFSKEIKASCTTTCDGCGKTLGEYYPKVKGSFEIELEDEEKDEYGYAKYRRMHTCGEECLRNLLNKRAGKK